MIIVDDEDQSKPIEQGMLVVSNHSAEIVLVTKVHTDNTFEGTSLKSDRKHREAPFHLDDWLKDSFHPFSGKVEIMN